MLFPVTFRVQVVDLIEQRSIDKHHNVVAIELAMVLGMVALDGQRCVLWLMVAEQGYIPVGVTDCIVLVNQVGFLYAEPRDNLNGRNEILSNR